MRGRLSRIPFSEWVLAWEAENAYPTLANGTAGGGRFRRNRQTHRFA